MLREIAGAVALTIGVVAQSTAQSAEDVSSLMIFSVRPTHGVSSYSDATVAEVSSNERLMEVFAGLLSGDVSSDLPWSPATVLWWLAQNGNPKYASLFLDWADRPDDDMGDQLAMVAHGLAVHASEPGVREKVLQIANERPEERRWLVGTLLLVNDEAAREVLAVLKQKGQLGGRAELVDSALSAPGRLVRPPRIGCAPNSSFGRTPGGPYECLPERGGN